MSGGAQYKVQVYCSYPDDVCVYDVSSSEALPAIDISLEQLQENASLITTSCYHGQVKLRGTTRVDAGFSNDLGMVYDVRAQILGDGRDVNCDASTLRIAGTDSQHLSIVLAAGTSYNESNGDAEHDFSFSGEDPSAYVQNAIDEVVAKTDAELLSAHIEDYGALGSAFTLNLPEIVDSV